MDTIRILVVDDHRLFAEAVAVRLAREPDFVILPLAYDEKQAIALLAEHTPDLLLLDVALGPGSGIAVLEHGRRAHPAARALMLTAVDSVDQLEEAVRRGATGWLPKTVDGDELVRAVRGVARGQGWIPHDLLGGLLERLVAEPHDDASAMLARLTVREREVFGFLVNGLSRAEIAERLFLSADTVRTHTQNLLRKLEAHSVLEAVALGLRAGMRPSRD